jgi:hypothetical protein
MLTTQLVVSKKGEKSFSRSSEVFRAKGPTSLEKIDLLSLLKQREDMLQSSVNRKATSYTQDEHQSFCPQP